MGYNAYNHMGAYIELPQVQEQYTKVIRRCSQKECSNHKNENMSKDFHFCNKCGTEIEEIETKEIRWTALDYYSFAEENGLDPEEFTQMNESILIPNRSFGSTVNWDENEQITQEFSVEEAQRCIEEYTRYAKEFMDKVKEIYNIDLKVKYGVVSYIM